MRLLERAQAGFERIGFLALYIEERLERVSVLVLVFTTCLMNTCRWGKASVFLAGVCQLRA